MCLHYHLHTQLTANLYIFKLQEDFYGFSEREIKKAERKLQGSASPKKTGIAQQRQLRKKVEESVKEMVDEGLVKRVDVASSLGESSMKSGRSARLQERNETKTLGDAPSGDKPAAA